LEISYNRYESHEDGSWTPWQTDETVFYGPTFRLNVKIQTQVLVQSGYKIDFSNSACAVSPCDPDLYKPKIQITDISIYTLNDFDEKHIKDSDVSDYFFSETHTEKYFIDYLNENSQDSYKLLEWLRLSQLPTKGSVHKFKLEFVLENRTKLSIETKEIILLPEK